MGEEDSRATLAAVILVVGGLLGAGLAMLFAPQSGKATRRDISRFARKTRRKAEDVVQDFSHSVVKMVDTVGEKAEEILDAGKDFAFEAKRDILRVFDKGQEQLEKQKSRLAKKIG